MRVINSIIKNNVLETRGDKRVLVEMFFGNERRRSFERVEKSVRWMDVLSIPDMLLKWRILRNFHILPSWDDLRTITDISKLYAIILAG